MTQLAVETVVLPDGRATVSHQGRPIDGCSGVPVASAISVLARYAAASGPIAMRSTLPDGSVRVDYIQPDGSLHPAPAPVPAAVPRPVAHTAALQAPAQVPAPLIHTNGSSDEDLRPAKRFSDAAQPSTSWTDKFDDEEQIDLEALQKETQASPGKPAASRQPSKRGTLILGIVLAVLIAAAMAALGLAYLADQSTAAAGQLVIERVAAVEVVNDKPSGAGVGADIEVPASMFIVAGFGLVMAVAAAAGILVQRSRSARPVTINE